MSLSCAKNGTVHASTVNQHKAKLKPKRISLHRVCAFLPFVAGKSVLEQAHF